MSIVEKALSKTRAEKPVDPAPPNRRAISPQSEAPVAAVEPPKRSIAIDVTTLRDEGLLPSDEFSARIRDDFRRIKWPLREVALQRAAGAVERPNLIMVASSLPEEGKSFTSLNLALAFADDRECSVLLVDGDIARPKISKVLGLEKERGLADLLVRDELAIRDVVLGTNIPGLTILPAGTPQTSGPELLAGRKMERIAEELAARPAGHIVVFDSSPLLATNEGQVLSRLVGQVVMVVKATATPRVAVKEAINLINRKASIGLLLNQNNASGAQYYGDQYEDSTA